MLRRRGMSGLGMTQIQDPTVAAVEQFLGRKLTEIEAAKVQSYASQGLDVPTIAGAMRQGYGTKGLFRNDDGSPNWKTIGLAVLVGFIVVKFATRRR